MKICNLILTYATERLFYIFTLDWLTRAPLGGVVGFHSQYVEEHLVKTVQYTCLNPALVDRSSVSAWSYKLPWITYQEEAKHFNDPRSLPINATYSCEVIHASLPSWWQPGVQSCIKPGLPMHLVQELNAVTVFVSSMWYALAHSMVTGNCASDRLIRLLRYLYMAAFSPAYQNTEQTEKS